MKISLDQPIAASAQQAQAAYLDPAFYSSLGELEGISPPKSALFRKGLTMPELCSATAFPGSSTVRPGCSLIPTRSPGLR